MSQAQKRKIGFLLAPIVTITACMIAFVYYSGVEAAPPNAGISLEDEAPSFGVRRILPLPPVVPNVTTNYSATLTINTRLLGSMAPGLK